MKKYSTFLVLMVLNGGLLAQTGRINDAEREFISNYLDASYLETKKVIENTSDELWTYKPKDGGWSVGECMEHIMLAEKAVFMQVKNALKKEGDVSKSLKGRDGLVISFAVDRGKKADTPLPPKGVLKSKVEYLSDLQKSREEIKSFLTDQTLELRSHFGSSPFGEVDAYQLVLIIAAHGQRHTAQMKQIVGEFTGQPVSY